MRSNKDQTVTIAPAKQQSLDDCMEYIVTDELLEVTPKNLRLLKNPKMDKKRR